MSRAFGRGTGGAGRGEWGICARLCVWGGSRRRRREPDMAVGDLLRVADDGPSLGRLGDAIVSNNLGDEIIDLK